MDIVTAVQSLGVPVAFCIALGYYIKHLNDQHREDVTRLSDQHKTEMKEVTEALQNNTIAIQKLTDFLIYKGGMEDA